MLLFAGGLAVASTAGVDSGYARIGIAMVHTMDDLGFGNCTNYYECSAVCPKLISHDFIARMNRDYLKATLRSGLRVTSLASSGGAA